MKKQQSSSSSSNRFIEHDVSVRKLGPSSGIPMKVDELRFEVREKLLAQSPVGISCLASGDGE